MKFFALIFALLLSTVSLAHKFYVSVTNMQWDEQEKAINISIRATDHDFQHAIEMSLNERVDLNTITDTSNYSRFIEKYLSEKFQILSRGEAGVFNYLGFELTDRLNIIFYFQVKQLINPKKIEVRNEFLFDFFPEQQNIVHYKYLDSTKSVTLIPSKPSGKIDFY